MTPAERFALKNRLLFYNLFTNLVGVWIVLLLSFRSISPPFYEIADLAHRINLVCIPILLLATMAVQLVYEAPIRRHLNASQDNISTDHQRHQAVKRRLLNAPFFIVAVDLAAWMGAAVIYAALYTTLSGNALAARRVFFQNSLVGLITSTASFFVIEQVLQKSLVPRFFPRGMTRSATPATSSTR